MNIEISRRFQFCAGHRVYKHKSKCKHLHGHNYVMNVFVTSDILDRLGRVIDFGVVKDKIGNFINQEIDHGFLLFKDDPMSSSDLFTKKYIMNANPTAENICILFLKEFQNLLDPYKITVTKIELWETENCKAEIRK